MKGNLRVLPVLLLAVLLAPSTASAFGIETVGDRLDGSIMRWRTNTIDITLDSAGTNGLTAAQSQQCFRDSLQGWQDVDCSALAFNVVGTTSNKKVLPMSSSYNIYENGKNELVWINDSSWSFGSQVLGVTMVNGAWSYSGTITESDIAFNGRNYKWNLDGDIGYWNNDMDCVSVAIHEIGHLFGLQHVLSGASVTDPPTMNPMVDPDGKSATLSRDDQLGACFLYPQDDYYTCTKNSECPKVVGHQTNGEEYEVGQIYCKNGYCQGAGGLAPYTVEQGGTCTKATDCVSGLSCMELYSGTSICTTACDLANDTCPTSYHCAVPEFTGATNPICVPGTKKKAIGEPCSLAYDCTTNFCYPAPDGSGMTCRQSCPKDQDTCPEGQKCWTTSYGAMGGCYPESEVPVDLKKLGFECATGSECSSGLCWAGPNDVARCLRPCELASPICYNGYYCLDMGDGNGACVPGDGKKDVGLECAGNDECRSAWCVPLVTDGKSYCRSSCDLSTWMCDWGFSCVSFGSNTQGVCMPSIDRQPAGNSCETGEDCNSTMCRDFGDLGRMCTQNCIDGWCPNDWVCVTGDAWGDICVPAGSVVQPPPETAVQEDIGTVDEDVPPAGEETSTGLDDNGLPPTQPVKSGGCSGASVPGAVPLLPVLLAFLGIASRRRRA